MPIPEVESPHFVLPAIRLCCCHPRQRQVQENKNDQALTLEGADLVEIIVMAKVD